LVIPVRGAPLGDADATHDPGRTVVTRWYQTDYRPASVGSPSWVLFYRRWFRPPPVVVGALALAALAALVLALVRRDAVPHRAEILLFAGSGLTMLFLSVAAADLVLRYLVAAEVPIILGGTLAVWDLVHLHPRFHVPQSAATT
jgi:hypothetical protein